MTDVKADQPRPSRRGLLRWLAGASATAAATGALSPSAVASTPEPTVRPDVLDGGAP